MLAVLSRGTLSGAHAVSVGFWGENLTRDRIVLLAGAAGVVAGVAMMLVIVLVAAARRRSRRRWEDSRRLAFVRMYQAVDSLALADDGFAESILVPGQAIAWLRGLRDAYAEAVLLARRRRTTKTLDNLFRTAAQLASVDGRDCEPLLREVHDETGRFFRAARRELGLPRGKWISYEESRAWQELPSLRRYTTEDLDLPDADRLVDQ
jgi:hypothetical protein